MLFGLFPTPLAVYMDAFKCSPDQGPELFQDGPLIIGSFALTDPYEFLPHLLSLTSGLEITLLKGVNSLLWFNSLTNCYCIIIIVIVIILYHDHLIPQRKICEDYKYQVKLPRRNSYKHRDFFFGTIQIIRYSQVITVLTGKDNIQSGQHIDKVRGKMNAFKQYIE